MESPAAVLSSSFHKLRNPDLHQHSYEASLILPTLISSPLNVNFGQTGRRKNFHISIEASKWFAHSVLIIWANTRQTKLRMWNVKRRKFSAEVKAPADGSDHIRDPSCQQLLNLISVSTQKSIINKFSARKAPFSYLWASCCRRGCQNQSRKDFVELN